MEENKNTIYIHSQEYCGKKQVEEKDTCGSCLV